MRYSLPTFDRVLRTILLVLETFDIATRLPLRDASPLSESQIDSIVMGKRVLYASEGTSLKLLPHEKLTDKFPNRIRKLRNLELTYSKRYLRDLFWDYPSLRSTCKKYNGLKLNLMEWERTRVLYSIKEGGLQERTNKQLNHLNLGS
jgi:hypothetical protein